MLTLAIILNSLLSTIAFQSEYSIRRQFLFHRWPVILLLLCASIWWTQYAIFGVFSNGLSNPFFQACASIFCLLVLVPFLFLGSLMVTNDVNALIKSFDSGPKKLSHINELICDGKLIEAKEVLVPLSQKYPNNKDIQELTFNLLVHMNNGDAAYKKAVTLLTMVSEEEKDPIFEKLQRLEPYRTPSLKSLHGRS